MHVDLGAVLAEKTHDLQVATCNPGVESGVTFLLGLRSCIEEESENIFMPQST